MGDKPKRKRGGQPGNRNALGNKGGAPLGNTNALKHGGYARITFDELTDEELELVATMDHDLEQLLLDEIRLLTVRERRIMHYINFYERIEGGLAVKFVIRSERCVDFNTPEEKALYKSRINAKVSAHKRMPGHRYHLRTELISTLHVILQLEAALIRCMELKRKALVDLHQYRMRSGQGMRASVAEDWIAAVLQSL